MVIPTYQDTGTGKRQVDIQYTGMHNTYSNNAYNVIYGKSNSVNGMYGNYI